MKIAPNFVDACLGLDEGFKKTAEGNWISNGAWAANIDVFGSTKVKRSAQYKSAEVVDNDRFSKLAPTKRAKFERTPLSWRVLNDEADATIVCFVAENGARVWIDSQYVDVFGIREVFGDDENPSPVVDGGKGWSVLFAPFIPPDGETLAALVLRDLRIVPLPEFDEKTTEEKPKRGRKKVTPAEAAVAAALPDPKEVAAEVPHNRVPGNKSPDLCEAVDCMIPRKGSGRFCSKHSAPDTTPGDELPKKCEKRGCLRRISAVIHNDSKRSSKFCDEHEKEEEKPTPEPEKKNSRKTSPARAESTDSGDWI